MCRCRSRSRSIRGHGYAGHAAIAGGDQDSGAGEEDAVLPGEYVRAVWTGAGGTAAGDDTVSSAVAVRGRWIYGGRARGGGEGDGSMGESGGGDRSEILSVERGGDLVDRSGQGAAGVGMAGADELRGVGAGDGGGGSLGGAAGCFAGGARVYRVRSLRELAAARSEEFVMDAKEVAPFMDLESRVFVAGHGGMVGAALMRGLDRGMWWRGDGRSWIFWMRGRFWPQRR
jgi:hypothetical protein